MLNIVIYNPFHWLQNLICGRWCNNQTLKGFPDRHPCSLQLSLGSHAVSLSLKQTDHCSVFTFSVWLGKWVVRKVLKTSQHFWVRLCTMWPDRGFPKSWRQQLSHLILLHSVIVSASNLSFTKRRRRKKKKRMGCCVEVYKISGTKISQHDRGSYLAIRSNLVPFVR